MMRSISYFILLLIGLSGPSDGQTLGRQQVFAYPEDAVRARAAIVYAAMIAELQAHGTLDDDADVYSRVRHISVGLIDRAIAQKPAARVWKWEVHTTSERNQEGDSFAGGKLLFGSGFIRALSLDDGELATLVSHEIAHAIAEHQREVLSRVFYLNPASIPITLDTAMERLKENLSLQIELSDLLKLQEIEADQIGMTIAYNAGWTPVSIVSFYQKLAAADSPTILSFGFPSARARLEMARKVRASIDEKGR